MAAGSNFSLNILNESDPSPQAETIKGAGQTDAMAQTFNFPAGIKAEVLRGLMVSSG